MSRGRVKSEDDTRNYYVRGVPLRDATTTRHVMLNISSFPSPLNTESIILSVCKYHLQRIKGCKNALAIWLGCSVVTSAQLWVFVHQRIC